MNQFKEKYYQNFYETVYIAKDGISALKLYKEHSIDIVISAIKIPKLNGIKLVKKIKAINPNQLVVFTTSHTDKEYLCEALELEVNGYLSKPINTSKLREKLLKMDIWVSVYIKKSLSMQMILFVI